MFLELFESIGMFVFGIRHPLENIWLMLGYVLLVSAVSIGPTMIISYYLKFRFLTSVLLLFSIFGGIFLGMGPAIVHQQKFSQCETRTVVIEPNSVQMIYCRNRDTLESKWNEWKPVRLKSQPK